ncbi:MAG TPA: isochorismatase family protein [Bacteroidales bacterium]|nr:isochorismatase family protein [Bacteroidales bacterium]HSA43694.1 isochorismatase family protein [Bacteroidales bacterium]
MISKKFKPGNLLQLVLLLCLPAAHPAVGQDSEFQDSSFLMILDMQEFYTSVHCTDSASENAIRAMNTLIERTSPDQVIYVTSASLSLSLSWKGIRVDTVYRHSLDKRLKVVNERLFDKTSGNAFSSGALTAFLTAKGAKEITVVGLMAEKCVKQSLLGGLEKGFRMVTYPEALIAKDGKSKQKTMIRLAKKGVRLVYR